MKINAFSSTTCRTLSAAVLAAAAGTVLTGIAAGSADAAISDNLPADCLKFSQDNGATWGTAGVIVWNTSEYPAPGGEIKHGSFQVKNVCDTPAKFQVYAGNWSVGAGGAATVRGTAGGVKGTTQQLAGLPGILVVESGRLTTDKSISVELFVGIPSSVTAQGFKITPDWSPSLEEVAPNAPTGPGDGGDGGSGPLDGVTGSSSGSLGDLLGRESSAFTGRSLHAPAVVGNR